MRLADRLAALLGYAPVKPRRRDFPSAQISRLTSSWTTDPSSINKWLRHDLRTVRARSRQLAKADGYASKFLHSCVANIAGANPFQLQAKIRLPRGKMDDAANKRLEQLWGQWTRKGACDVTGTLSLADIHRVVIRTLAQDGEALVRIHRPTSSRDNIRLQVLDIDRLDEEKNDTPPAGNVIKLGVEVNAFGRPVAYHILKTVPGEIGYWGQSGIKEYTRIPAEEILHLFIPQYAEQVRGLPWMHSALLRLHHLSGFEEAAVIAARVGASKMGFYTSPDGQPPSSAADAVDTKGRLIEDAEPGAFGVLPEGYGFESFTPNFPDAAVETFMRSTLRGISAGWGCAYHSIANDPSNVNYSTARVALLEERDMWNAIQSWYIDSFCRPLFDTWRAAAVAVGDLPLEWRTQDRYNAIEWQRKTWQWVDPLKDIQAEIEALNNGLTSRTRIAAKGGEDIEDIFDELQAEEAMAKQRGLEFGEEETKPEPAEPAGKPETEDSDDGRAIRRVA